MAANRSLRADPLACICAELNWASWANLLLCTALYIWQSRWRQSERWSGRGNSPIASPPSDNRKADIHPRKWISSRTPPFVHLTSICTACLGCEENAKAAILIQCCIFSELTSRPESAAAIHLCIWKNHRGMRKAANHLQSNNVLIRRRGVRAVKEGGLALKRDGHSANETAD